MPKKTGSLLKSMGKHYLPDRHAVGEGAPAVGKPTKTVVKKRPHVKRKP